MSNRARSGATLKVIAVNLIVLVGLLGVAEIAARLIYPEFQGHIHSATRTLGYRHYSADFHGFSIRVPHPGYRPVAGRPLFVVLGDSISNGYGMAYEDIYWVRLWRVVESSSAADLEFLALSGYGNNLTDSTKALESLTGTAGVTVRFVLYQFNLNDITPYGRAELRNPRNEGVVHQGLFRTLAFWRYEYMNHSVFLRVAQHYAGMAARRLSGTCEQRGLDALGPYTWSYGSRPYRNEAENHWREFESSLGQLKWTADRLGARFVVFISPLVFDIDRAGRHPYFNHTRLDFSCGTIDPRARLGEIAANLGIRVFDPASYVRERFEARLAEGNFTPFYHTADENHFNAVAADHVAEYLASVIFHATPTASSATRPP